ncbi:hypothetical protein P7C70_g6582, partial [Phenoliferia sp. Uapishka_3]
MQSAGVNVPRAQQMRFARKTPNKQAGIMPVKFVSIALLKDHNLSRVKPGWTPSYLVAFRMIILLRFFAAMYTSISDCDEVFNYWEPLHYLVRGSGFQTWEYSPVYAIRSYFYLLVNALPSFIAQKFPDKRVSFFALRLTFATVSSFVEAALYRATVVHISPHVGRYLLWSLLFSAAFYSASTAFLPSTFAMWGVMLGQAEALSPVDGSYRRITRIALAFATAALVGWPFAAVLAVPIVFEQMFLRGTEKFAEGQGALWAAKRARGMFIAGVAGASLLIPIVFVDSKAYQKLAIVPWNIVKYNVLSTSGGPSLYGVSPSYFYLQNGLLGFNILLPLALISLPVLVISTIVDPKRFGDKRDRIAAHTPSPVSIAVRLSPMYLWIAIISAQPHKEERFLFPAYGLIMLNACTTLYLLRGWFEQAFLKYTKSPYRATQTSMFSNFTRVVLALTAIISAFRIAALHTYYHAPLNVYHHLQVYELPRLALTTYPSLYPDISLDPTLPFANFSKILFDAEYTVDIEPLKALELRLCLGKEWHRFPSSFLVPDEVEVRFIKSAFEGILPKVWEEPGPGKGLFGRATGVVPKGMNDQNLEEPDRYVDLSTCHYIVDLDFPLRTRPTPPSEPRYAVDSENWDRVHCHHFLDNEESDRISRTLWVPFPGWSKGNRFGDYCLLRNKELL